MKKNVLPKLLKAMQEELKRKRARLHHAVEYRTAAYEVSELAIRCQILQHVIDYMDDMEQHIAEFWLECVRYDGSYDFSMQRRDPNLEPNMVTAQMAYQIASAREEAELQNTTSVSYDQQTER